jgi:hypothetical protein
MGGFVLGVVIALLINCLTAVFSRKHALQLVPWLLLYCALHGGIVLLGTGVVWGEAMNLAQRYHSRWSYVVVAIAFAICGLVFWALIQTATKRLDMRTTTPTNGVDLPMPSSELPKLPHPSTELPKPHHASPMAMPSSAPSIETAAKPEIFAMFIQATSPGVVLMNKTDAVIKDPICTLQMWNLSKTPPIVLPSWDEPQPNRFIKKGTGLLLATLDNDKMKPLISDGDRVFGYVMVDCPDCKAARFYWLYAPYNRPTEAWYSEIPVGTVMNVLLISTLLEQSGWNVEVFLSKVPHGPKKTPEKGGDMTPHFDKP